MHELQRINLILRVIVVVHIWSLFLLFFLFLFDFSSRGTIMMNLRWTVLYPDLSFQRLHYGLTYFCMNEGAELTGARILLGHGGWSRSNVEVQLFHKVVRVVVFAPIKIVNWTSIATFLSLQGLFFQNMFIVVWAILWFLDVNNQVIRNFFS